MTLQEREARREFVRSGVLWGVGEPYGELRRWWEKFRAPLKRKEGVGRWANKFPITAEVVLTSEYFHITDSGVRGRGMVGAGVSPHDVVVKGGRSRSVLGVVTGMARSVALAQGIGGGGLGFRIFPKRGGTVEFERVKGEMLEEVFGVKELLGALGIEVKPLEGWKFKLDGGVFSNPWKMFLVLTLMKLVVLEPEMRRGVGSPQERARNILAWWKTQDDDARLALEVLVKRGWPTGEWEWQGVEDARKLVDTRSWATPQWPKVEEEDLRVGERLVMGEKGEVKFTVQEFPVVPPGWVWGGRVGARRLQEVLGGICFRETDFGEIRGRLVGVPREMWRKRKEIEEILGTKVESEEGRVWMLGAEWLREKGVEGRLLKVLKMSKGIVGVGETPEMEGKPPKKKVLVSRVLFQV